MDPIGFPCPRCGAKAGMKCKNYKGQNKFTCQPRLDQVKAPPSEEGPRRFVDQGDVVQRELWG